MSFDSKAFCRAEFEPRTGEMPVPFLQSFFGEDEEAKFVVRGLDIYELAKVKDAATKDQSIDILLKVFLNDKSMVAAMKDAIGVTADVVTAELSGRIEAFKLGLVSPEIDHRAMLLFAKRFPNIFWNLTQMILNLTDSGMDVKK